MTTLPEEARARSGRRYRIAAAATVLLLAVAGGGLWAALTTTDDARIRGVVTEFAAAVDRQDYPAMLERLCAEEAAAITDDEDYDPAAEPIDADVPEREVTDVRIAPDERSATALLTTPGREPLTIHLSRERDRWTICSPS